MILESESIDELLPEGRIERCGAGSIAASCRCAMRYTSRHVNTACACGAGWTTRAIGNDRGGHAQSEAWGCNPGSHHESAPL